MKIELTEQNLYVLMGALRDAQNYHAEFAQYHNISRAEENVHYCICNDLVGLMAKIERKVKEQ